MTYETLPDGTKRWTRNVRLSRCKERLRKVGKKGRKWAGARRELKVEFERVYGITICEGEFTGCTFDDFLSFAHRLKRRHIVTKEDLKNCLLLCFNCHWEIERGGEERMGVMFDEIKARRAA